MLSAEVNYPKIVSQGIFSLKLILCFHADTLPSLFGTQRLAAIVLPVVFGYIT